MSQIIRRSQKLVSDSEAYFDETLRDMTNFNFQEWLIEAKTILKEHGYTVKRQTVGERRKIKKHRRHGKPWMTIEVSSVLGSFYSGDNLWSLSQQTERTPSAVLSFLVKKKLVRYDVESKGWVREDFSLFVSYHDLKNYKI